MYSSTSIFETIPTIAPASTKKYHASSPYQ